MQFRALAIQWLPGGATRPVASSRDRPLPNGPGPAALIIRLKLPMTALANMQQQN